MLPYLRPLRLFLSLALLGVILPARAFDLDDLQRQLSQPETLYGHFEQQHWLRSQQTRLYSEGRFLYRRGQQLIWKFDTPVEATLIFRHDPGMGDFDEEASVMPTNGDALAELLPNRPEFRHHLIDLLSGDWERLGPYYAMRLEGEQDDWQLLLSPRAPILETTLSDMRLSGGGTWERLTMKSIDGDELTIEFDSISPMIDDALVRFLAEGFAPPEAAVQEASAEEGSEDVVDAEEDAEPEAVEEAATPETEDDA